MGLQWGWRGGLGLKLKELQTLSYVPGGLLLLLIPQMRVSKSAEKAGQQKCEAGHTRVSHRKERVMTAFNLFFLIHGHETPCFFMF